MVCNFFGLIMILRMFNLKNVSLLFYTVMKFNSKVSSTMVKTLVFKEVSTIIIKKEQELP